jgi:hypothetical protein
VLLLGAAFFASRINSLQASIWVPSSRMVMDSDDGPSTFDNRPCGAMRCMSVQLNGLTTEMDLPLAVGRFMTRFGKAAQVHGTGRAPGANTILITFDAYDFDQDGKRTSKRWITAEVPIDQLIAAKPSDMNEATNVISALPFKSPEATAAIARFCQEPLNRLGSARFCSLG